MTRSCFCVRISRAFSRSGSLFEFAVDACGSILIRAPIGPGLESDYNIEKNNFNSFAADGEGNRRVGLSAWQEMGYDIHSFVAQARELFENERSADFRLREGSPAVDAGIEAEVASDLLGMRRPKGDRVDIGSYEY